jgi:hypothetical protein
MQVVRAKISAAVLAAIFAARSVLKNSIGAAHRLLRCHAVSVGKLRMSASLEDVATHVHSCAAAFKTAVL